MQNQGYTFLIFVLNGLLIGILFDIFRILRKSFKTKDFVTNIEDIAFAAMTGLLILFSIMKFNNGEIRVYLFFGILIGLILYLLIFSKIFIKISVAFIKILKRIIKILIIIPAQIVVKTLKKLIFKPIIFVCINIRKNLIKFYKKIKKLKGFRGVL